MSRKDLNYNKANHLKMGQKADVIRINTGNTLIHELVKSAAFYVLKGEGFEVVTEAEWGNGWNGRADLYVPEVPCYIEILETETLEQVKRKCEKYPKMGDFVVRCSDMPRDISEWEKYLKGILPDRSG